MVIVGSAYFPFSNIYRSGREWSIIFFITEVDMLGKQGNNQFPHQI